MDLHFIAVFFYRMLSSGCFGAFQQKLGSTVPLVSRSVLCKNGRGGMAGKKMLTAASGPFASLLNVVHCFEDCINKYSRNI